MSRRRLSFNLRLITVKTICPFCNSIIELDHGIWDRMAEDGLTPICYSCISTKQEWNGRHRSIRVNYQPIRYLNWHHSIFSSSSWKLV